MGFHKQPTQQIMTAQTNNQVILHLIYIFYTLIPLKLPILCTSITIYPEINEAYWDEINFEHLC
jgi:hypothetical protein